MRLTNSAEIILCIINRMASRRAHKILELVSSSSSLSLQSHEVKPVAETHNATVEDLNNIPSENIENLPPNKNLTDLRSTDGQVQSDDHKKLEISLVSSCDEILSENADDHLHFSQKIDSRLISSRNIENKSFDTDEKRLPTSLVPDYDSDDYNNLECIGVLQDITKKHNRNHPRVQQVQVHHHLVLLLLELPQIQMILHLRKQKKNLKTAKQ
ncbi:unnamed protein product [Parnassius apollo]|uniref:(apollo) hypothetical protein n=1 Tax=Parnassius apollo TaxID=110799 RepID=A0A8S3Y8X0_PARAO|nr:unnamed protein product [Parnassius apollo]